MCAHVCPYVCVVVMLGKVPMETSSGREPIELESFIRIHLTGTFEEKTRDITGWTRDQYR